MRARPTRHVHRANQRRRASVSNSRRKSQSSILSAKFEEDESDKKKVEVAIKEIPFSLKNAELVMLEVVARAGEKQ